MDPITAAGLGLQLYGGLSGLFGGNAARKRAEQQRLHLLDDTDAQLNAQLNDLRSGNSTNLATQTGLAGDYIHELARRLGDEAANAGIFNSTGTAGLLSQGQNNASSILAQLAEQNRQNELGMAGQNQRYMTGLRMGVANDAVDQGRQQQAMGAGGLQSWIQSLTQGNLRNSGATTTREAGPAGVGLNNSVLKAIGAPSGARIGGIGGLFGGITNGYNGGGQLTGGFSSLFKPKKFSSLGMN